MERVGGTFVRVRVVEAVVVGTRVGWIVSGIVGGAGASLCWRMASCRLVGSMWVWGMDVKTPHTGSCFFSESI